MSIPPRRRQPNRRSTRGPGFWTLALGSVGVVYGDIGTSPLYAFEALPPRGGRRGVPASMVLGVLSLILWSLILIVTVEIRR